MEPKLEPRDVERMKLACPVDGAALALAGDGSLRCAHGHSFPVVDGIPVLLRDDIEQTIDLAHASIARAKGLPGSIDERNPSLYLESLGISEEEKLTALALAADPATPLDPAASVLVAATNGIAYAHLVGKVSGYPIPEIRLAEGNGKRLLDIGCSWGRWSIAAARKGYNVTSLDPSLGALMAARRISRAMGLKIDFVCADARFLPFADASFDTVYSYSVIQHFSRADARTTIAGVSRVLRAGGESLIQMPNAWGIRSAMHLARRRFSEGERFEVRYWSVPELNETFSGLIGPTRSSIHCFFGLGLEPSDAALMRPALASLIRISEALRAVGRVVTPLRYVADSVYLHSTKSGAARG